MLKASDVMTKDVITVGRNTPVRDLAELFVQHRISSIPVVDDGILVGMVTETDLIEKENLRPRDFRPTYYAALLARCAIGDGDHAAAFRYLRLGLLFPQDRDQLLYLTRVLDRIIPPELMDEYIRKATTQDPRVTSQ